MNKFIALFILAAAPASAQALNERQRDAVETFWYAQEECKGGIPGTAAMREACDIREEAQLEMIDEGLCWGYENGPHTYMRAVHCSDPAAYETIMGMSLR